MAAVELIEVDYEPLPPVMNLDDALKGDVLLHEEFEEDGKFSNVYEREVNEIGDVEAGFAEAEVVIERSFTTPTIHQGYIEPSACLASYDEGAQSTIWTTTQGHFNIRDNLADQMDMDVDKLKVIATEIGGGFGGKTAVYLEAMALMLSKALRTSGQDAHDARRRVSLCGPRRRQQVDRQDRCQARRHDHGDAGVPRIRVGRVPGSAPGRRHALRLFGL